jgi:thiamine-phosphate pyrophosphorylase
MRPEKRIDLSLYLVTDRGLARNFSLEELVERAVEGGVTVVQLREKECSSREFYKLALRVKKIIPPDVPLIINDRLDIALACGADGLHLGQHDLPAAVARKHIGPEAIIGLSVENFDQLKQSVNLPVDYLAISPVFLTLTKTDTGAAWGVNGLKQARQFTDFPLVAIGGINESNAVSVIKAGADGIAVVSAICAAPDPKEASKKLRQLVEQARQK